MDVEGTLKEIVRDLGRFEARLEHGDQIMVNIAKRLDAIDARIAARFEALDGRMNTADNEDALRRGMVKGGWWILTALMAVVATMASFLTSAFKQWLGTP